MKFFILSYCLVPVFAVASPLQRGMEAKTNGDFELATRELGAAVKVQPENSEAWLQYGTVLGWQKRYDEALVAINRGLEISPKNYELQMVRGRVIAWQGNFSEATEVFAELAKEYPDAEEILVMQGRIAMWSGRSDQAEGFYQKVIAKNPEQVDALTGLGDVALERKKHDEAEKFFLRALAFDPSPDIQGRLDRMAQETFNRIDFGITASNFAGGGRSDWWSYWTQYSAQTALGVFWGKLEQGERFDEADYILEIGWERKILDNLQTRMFVGGSPDAFWAANWYAETNLLWKPQEEFPGIIAEFKYADYVPRGVFTSRLGIEQEFDDGWKTSLRWVNQQFESGDPTNGWILAVNKEYDSGYGWVLGVAQGAESLDGQALVAAAVLDSTTYFGGIRGPINDNWGWRVDFEFEDYDVGANRRGLAFGVHCKF